MTPGRPPPPFLREYRSGRRSDCGTCIQRLAHVTEYPPEVYGPRLAEIPSHRGGVFTDAHTALESGRVPHARPPARAASCTRGLRVRVPPNDAGRPLR